MPVVDAMSRSQIRETLGVPEILHASLRAHFVTFLRGASDDISGDTVL